MSEKIIHAKSRFKFRSDTAANWAQNNPVLLAGEFGVVTDGTETDRVKIGDGMTAWNSLDWWRGPQGVKGDKGNTGSRGYKGDSIINVRIDSGNLLVTTWEKIGSTDVDLTGYATETWVNTQIANFLTQSQIESLITTALANYDTSAQVDAKLANKVDKFDILESIDYVIENGEAIILGRKSTVSADKFVGHITLPSTITENGVTYPVTGLGVLGHDVQGTGFKSCTKITGVDIPPTVTFIGNTFFKEAVNLS